MDKKDKEKYKKRQKLYEKLGAEKFQKVVFAVEETKFRVLKKCFPNFLKHFERYCYWKQKRDLGEAKTEKEADEITRRTQLCIMAMRKEWNQEKNRNYHIDQKRPTEIFEYLEWNKQVHKSGLIKDGILIPILIAGVTLQVPFTVPILILEILSAFVNFECINIQNYNLCRLERLKSTLEKRQETIIEKNMEKYGKAAEVIHKSIQKTDKVPNIENLIANIKNKEQLDQLKAWLENEKRQREMQKKELLENETGESQKKLGGM